MRLMLTKAACLVLLVVIAGCTTEQAKKAMDKPLPETGYSGFGAGTSEKSKRSAEKPKVVRDDMDPDEAVSTLVKQLQHTQAGYSITAEEQLMYWGQRPGVGPIVARKVRPLLKSAQVEQRAPALRLVIAYGGRDSAGDLIECLADSEYGIRETAYHALQTYVPRNLGYDPGSGDVARAQGVDQYRRWWQYETRKDSVHPATIYEANPPTEAQVRSPRQPQQTASTGANVIH